MLHIVRCCGQPRKIMNTKQIYWTISLGLIILCCLNIYRGWKRDLLVKKYMTTYTESVDNLKTKKVINFKTSGTISGIEISVDGEIRGSGMLAVMYNDSTTYKEYKLDSGQINIIHKSDWYADNCVVTFTPQSLRATGKLKITCDFIGD